MKSIILFPKSNINGNIQWRKVDALSKQAQIDQSILKLKARGYWASCFPEGDGVTFSHESLPSQDVILSDIENAFDWLQISVAKTNNANLELAELEVGREILCTIIVPLSKIKIENTFQLAEYRFVCRIDFDEEPSERLGGYECEYLEFKTMLLFKDFLKIDLSFGHNNMVINKCLALAENAMDVIRYQFSSFLKPEFTPNPAGQLENGIYSIQIVPEEVTHKKSEPLMGISKPFSFSNNWLGPEVENRIDRGIFYLKEILSGRNDELALSVKVALRACRQSFYTSGDESRFFESYLYP